MNFEAMFITIIAGFFLFMTSVWIHELAHIWTLRFYGYKRKVKEEAGVYSIRLPVTLKRKQKKLVLLNGIIAGILYIALWSLIIPEFAFLILPYLYGCKHDLKEMMQ